MKKWKETSEVNLSKQYLYFIIRKISLSADVANQKSRSLYGAIYMICCVSRAKILLSKLKMWWIMKFWAVFLDFVIFSIFDDFPMIWLSISIFWLDFLPRGGLRSPGHWIFTQNRNFVKDVTGRNKKYQKYQLWAPDEFIIPPSSRALALHALIISLKPSGKTRSRR